MGVVRAAGSPRGGLTAALYKGRATAPVMPGGASGEDKSNESGGGGVGDGGNGCC